jgi:hypothetical protein
VTSPTAFALFKAKQRNKKHVDQYINTIWPYEIKKNNDGKGRIINKDVFNPMIIFLGDLLVKGEGGYLDRSYEFGRDVTAEELILAIKSLKAIGLPERENLIGHMVLISRDRNMEACYINISPENNDFLGEAKKELEKVPKYSKNYSISTDTSGVRKGTTKYVEGLIKQLFMFKGVNRSKFKRIYLGQNVGIEIEYEGIWQKYLEKRLNSSRYAVSFNSGVDGGSTDGSKYNSESRLRENRLRINGHRGLSALHYLVDDMTKSSCSITNKSGMHYHIDLTHVPPGKQKGVDVLIKFKEIIKDKGLMPHIIDIFEMKEPSNAAAQLVSALRYPTNFTTIEWRMGTPTFNFTKLTIQILCAIHVTNVLFGSKKNIDAEYLKYLAEIYIKINS